MQFGLSVKKAKAQRPQLKKGIFGDDDGDDSGNAAVGSAPKGQHSLYGGGATSGIRAVNMSLTTSSYSSAEVSGGGGGFRSASSALPIDDDDVDPSIYDFDGALEARDAKRAAEKQTDSSSSCGLAKKENKALPKAASYIGGLLDSARIRDKEKELLK